MGDRSHWHLRSRPICGFGSFKSVSTAVAHLNCKVISLLVVCHDDGRNGGSLGPKAGNLAFGKLSGWLFNEPELSETIARMLIS